MKAVIWTKYGPPEGLQLQEVEKPVPKDEEVLVKIHAATVFAGDCEFRRLDFPLWMQIGLRLYAGLFKPKRIQILGQEFSGEVESIGKNVTRFKEGDQIFGTTGVGMGGYAEYICLPENPASAALAEKPKNMSYREAAAVPVGGLEALHFLKQAHIQKGQKVLINGSGGSIGTVAVQLAKYYGAEVTCVDCAAKLEMLRSVGADHVIDYEEEDFTKNDEIYDVIFDVIGKCSITVCKRLLAAEGYMLKANTGFGNRVRSSGPDSKTGGITIVTGTAAHDSDDLVFLKKLIEEGYISSVIDKIYPLEEIVKAHRYVDTGMKSGNVVIQIAP